MAELGRSIHPARFDAGSMSLRQKPRELCDFEKHLIRELFNYFSVDPEQRNIDFVTAVWIYLQFSFGGGAVEGLPIPSQFDWKLIDKIGEEQMVSTSALFALWQDYQANTHDRDALIRYATRTLGQAAALYEASKARQLARSGANARHAENRALRRHAIEEFRSGNFPSKDAAAEYISRKVVPVKFRTVRDWLKGIEADD